MLLSIVALNWHTLNSTHAFFSMLSKRDDITRICVSTLRSRTLMQSLIAGIAETVVSTSVNLERFFFACTLRTDARLLTHTKDQETSTEHLSFQNSLVVLRTVLERQRRHTQASCTHDCCTMASTPLVCKLSGINEAVSEGGACTITLSLADMRNSKIATNQPVGVSTPSHIPQHSFWLAHDKHFNLGAACRLS